MPISWQYTDIYGVIIRYIADHLDPTNYFLNFGIIAINELHPKVIIRFTLKILEITLVRPGHRLWKEKCWRTCLIMFMLQWKCKKLMFGNFVCKL